MLARVRVRRRGRARAAVAAPAPPAAAPHPPAPAARRLLYRSDRVYAEAAKCYQNALRCDADNAQILTDLALLQVQLRDAPGHVATRSRLLKLKPGARGAWVGLAVAHHAAGEPALAAQVLDQYAALAPAEPAATEKYEHSELLLYRSSLLEEAGQHAAALALLDAHSSHIPDKPSEKEQRGRLQLALGDAAAAEATYRGLLATAPETHGHHDGLRRALGLGGDADAMGDADVAKLAELYHGLALSAPRSAAARRLPLAFLRPPAFAPALEAYIRPFLRKGVPALGCDLAPLHSGAGGAAWRSDAVAAVVDAAVVSLRDRSAFPGEADGSEPPGVLPWALLLQASTRSSRRDHAGAVASADEALAHTPTCIDALSLRARIRASAGDAALAADDAEAARRLDLADRHLNSASVQALLAAGRVADAEAVASLFARAGAGGGPAPDGAANLIDMQCGWYILGVGDAHARAGRHGPALKRFTLIRKLWDDFAEDQFDFHGYCVRKMTLRSYVHLLRFVDNLPGHATFRAAARGAIGVYLSIADDIAAKQAHRRSAAAAGGGGGGNGSVGGSSNGGGGAAHEAGANGDGGAAGGDCAAAAGGGGNGGSTANERKKAKAKAKKAEAAAAAAAADAAAQAAATAASAAGAAASASSLTSSGDAATCAADASDSDATVSASLPASSAASKPSKSSGLDLPPPKIDPDPDGALLASTPDPLGEAAKWVGQLEAHAARFVETHALALEVHTRRGHLLLALRAARRAAALAAEEGGGGGGGGGGNAAADGAAPPPPPRPLPPPALAPPRGAASLSARATAHSATVRFLRDASRALWPPSSSSSSSSSSAAAAAAAPPKVLHPTVATILREGVAQLLGSAGDVAAFNAAFGAKAAAAGDAAGVAAHKAAAALLAG